MILICISLASFVPSEKARRLRQKQMGGRIVGVDRGLPVFTAKCRTVHDGVGFRLTFFCEICGSGYTTPLFLCNTPQEALRLGEQDARLHFNRCLRCHRWVCDEHFNENRLMCTDCVPRICARCNSPVSKGSTFCSVCGAPLSSVE